MGKNVIGKQKLEHSCATSNTVTVLLLLLLLPLLNTTTTYYNILLHTTTTYYILLHTAYYFLVFVHLAYFPLFQRSFQVKTDSQTSPNEEPLWIVDAGVLLQVRCSSCHPTNSIKTLKGRRFIKIAYNIFSYFVRAVSRLPTDGTRRPARADCRRPRRRR